MKSAFLDDQLYDYVKESNIKDTGDFTYMMNELYQMCEMRYKSELSMFTPKREIKASLDRVFKSWDLLVARLKKENYFLVDFIEKNSYKNTWMKDERMVELYKSL